MLSPKLWPCMSSGRPGAARARRDHRKLGAELDLFSINEAAGPGLVFWHPKGAMVRHIIEDYWKQTHLARGYQLLYTCAPSARRFPRPRRTAGPTRMGRAGLRVRDVGERCSAQARPLVRSQLAQFNAGGKAVGAGGRRCAAHDRRREAPSRPLPAGVQPASAGPPPGAQGAAEAHLKHAAGGRAWRWGRAS